MRLPLTAFPGEYRNGVLTRCPDVKDADGCQVVAIAWSQALAGSSVEQLNDVAALFAAAPDLHVALRVCASVLSGDDMTKGMLVHGLELARSAFVKAKALSSGVPIAPDLTGDAAYNELVRKIKLARETYESLQAEHVTLTGRRLS